MLARNSAECRNHSTRNRRVYKPLDNHSKLSSSLHQQRWLCSLTNIVHAAWKLSHTTMTYPPVFGPWFVSQISVNVHIRLTTFSGTKRRLSSSPRLRPLWCRQENTHRRHPPRALRSWCRKDQDRFPRLPNQQQSEARIQHRRLCLPPRNHTVGCCKL